MVLLCNPLHALKLQFTNLELCLGARALLGKLQLTNFELRERALPLVAARARVLATALRLLARSRRRRLARRLQRTRRLLAPLALIRESFGSDGERAKEPLGALAHRTKLSVKDGALGARLGVLHTQLLRLRSRCIKLISRVHTRVHTAQYTSTRGITYRSSPRYILSRPENMIRMSSMCGPVERPRVDLVK